MEQGILYSIFCSIFNLDQQKYLLIQIKPPADVTNFELRKAQFKIWTQLRRDVIDNMNQQEKGDFL